MVVIWGFCPLTKSILVKVIDAEVLVGDSLTSLLVVECALVVTQGL